MEFKCEKIVQWKPPYKITWPNYSRSRFCKRPGNGFIGQCRPCEISLIKVMRYVAIYTGEMRGNVSVSLATCEGATKWPVCRDATDISLLTPALSRSWTFKLLPVTSPHFLHSGSRGLVAEEKNPNLSAKDIHYLFLPHRLDIRHGDMMSPLSLMISQVLMQRWVVMFKITIHNRLRDEWIVDMT